MTLATPCVCGFEAKATGLYYIWRQYTVMSDTTYQDTHLKAAATEMSLLTSSAKNRKCEATTVHAITESFTSSIVLLSQIFGPLYPLAYDIARKH